jgi:predicted nucleic acid-binding protein
VVIDASVWVSYYIAGQAHHEETVAWLDGVIRRQEALLLPSLALPEIGGALSRQTGDAGLALLALQEIIDYPQLRIVHMCFRYSGMAHFDTWEWPTFDD